MFLLLFALLLCSPFSLAIHESDIGVIDWYKKLIGVPLAPPVFHHSAKNEAPSSLLLVPTASNVLAALNTTDGSVAWRYVFEAADDIASFHVNGDVVVALSGQGASMLRSFEASTGLISFEKRLDAPRVGPKGIDVVFEPNTGAMFALNTHLISRVGEVRWTWDAPDKIQTYSKLVHTGAALYAVGLSQQIATLYLAAINPVTGAQIHVSWKHLPPSVSSFVVAGDTVVWVDPASEGMGWVQLAPALKGHIKTEKTQKWLAVVDVDLRDSELFVGVLANGEARVLRVHEGVMETIHTFPANDGLQALFAGGLNKAGEPYVARLWTTASNMTAVSIYTPGQDAVTATFQLDTYRHGTISHLAIDGTRLAITTSTGAVQLWEQDQLVWGREESLAAIDHRCVCRAPIARARRASERRGRVVRLPADEADRGHEGLPTYAAAFAQRFVTGAAPPDEVVVSAHNHTASLARDAFGFKQVLVAATAYGSVFGLDTASGAILWTRVLGLGWAGDGTGGTVKPVKMFVVDGHG
ncbi:hypothetical protein B0H12DRAFT_377405, partial [Mycena haematopus]